MYVVRENRDGTVTIDRKVYEELHRRACTERTEYAPLTPDMRAAVNNSIDQHIAELNACEDTPWVNMGRCANEALRNLINALPDGYPLPVTRREGR